MEKNNSSRVAGQCKTLSPVLIISGSIRSCISARQKVRYLYLVVLMTCSWSPRVWVSASSLLIFSHAFRPGSSPCVYGRFFNASSSAYIFFSHTPHPHHRPTLNEESPTTTFVAFELNWMDSLCCAAMLCVFLLSSRNHCHIKK